MILVDDLGWADVSTYGLKRVLTPNIDRIAEQGVAFTNGYVAASVCAPSRAALMTGLYPQRYGFEYNISDDKNIDDGLPFDQKTMGDRLQEAGYHTGVVGKWNLGYKAGYYPMNRGFDEFYGFMSGETIYVDPKAPDIVTVQTPERVMADQRKPSGEIVEGPDAKVVANFDKYLTTEITSHAVSFIQARGNQEKPFFLYLAYNAPHWPMQVPRAYYDRFPEIKDPVRRTYVAMITALDDGVGQVLDELKRQGVDKNTLIVFLSDNGCPERLGFCDCSHPLGAGKFTYFEGGMHVPFMMAWPARLAPRQPVATPVSSLDIMPTVLNAAGVTPPEMLDGKDLVATAEAPTDMSRALFWRQKPVYAMREGKWKLWRSLDWETTKLFDLDSDPAETSDVSQENPEVVEKLSASLERWDSGMSPPRWPIHSSRSVNVCFRQTEMVY